MKRKMLLMVFLRSPGANRPTPDLAEALGVKNAIAVSDKLLQLSLSSTKTLHCDKVVYYPVMPEGGDAWSKAGFKQKQQEGINPGQIFQAAFSGAFEKGYKYVIALYGNKFELINRQASKGFEMLQNNDVIVGPAVDGGYYLIGMSKMYPELFRNKPWNTGSLLKETIRDLLSLDLSFEGLPEEEEETVSNDIELSQAHL